MRIIKAVLLVLVTFGYSGCQEVILEDAQTVTDSNITVHDGALPVINSPIGEYVDFSEYLYPKDLTTDETFYFQKVYNYAQTSSNTFTQAPEVFQKSYTKTIDGDITTVVEYKDNLEREKYIIYRYKIESIKKDREFPIEYPVRVAKNSVIYDIVEDGVQEVCVVVYIGKLDLSTTTYLPLFVRNDLLENQLKTENGNFLPEQFVFDDIMHIYCGTNDNHTKDIYYSKKYGKVLEHRKDIDKNLLTVEVTDVLSAIND